METQRSKTRVLIVVVALVALSGVSLVGLAAEWGLYGGSAGNLDVANPGLAITPTAATTAAYIKFDGVDGEAVDRDHRNWSDLLSFSQGQFLALPSASARAVGRVVFEDIVITKELDKASPKLAEAVARGKVFPKVEIHLTTGAGDARQTYYAYELKNVLITSYSVSGSGQSDVVPTDQISLNFEEIKTTYTPFDVTGKPQAGVEYSWKVEEGTK